MLKGAENFEADKYGVKPYITKYYLLNLSIELFDNIKIIPFIASIGLLFVTYLITKEITNRRFAGIISILVVLQSSLFLKYDTIATYENFWTLFYFISIYLIIKRWYLSPFIFMISVFSKSLTVLFLPITLFFVFRSKISRKGKIFTYILYAIIKNITI